MSSVIAVLDASRNLLSEQRYPSISLRAGFESRRFSEIGLLPDEINLRTNSKSS